VFIGCASEVRPVAEKVKERFGTKQFDVDIWSDGIFTRTRKAGGDISNAENLKNFTDIYDFAIFIFTPDDQIVSKTRFPKPGELLEASGTRHNVVFEFGMFLGRIGARKSFILFDDGATEWVEYFFTDLCENLDDVEKVSEDKFKIELYNCKGNLSKMADEKTPDILYAQIDKIKRRMAESFEDIDINFLPATSLAIGNFNNFIEMFLTFVDIIKNGKSYPESWEKQTIDEKVRELVKTKENIKFKLVIPETLEMTKQDNFNPYINNELFERGSFPGRYRLMTMNYKKPEGSNFFVYDIPSTMNSSIDAIEILTSYDDIQRLLSQKEIRNFKKTTRHKIDLLKQTSKLDIDIDEIINIISWDEFLEETDQAVSCHS